MLECKNTQHFPFVLLPLLQVPLPVRVRRQLKFHPIY